MAYAERSFDAANGKLDILLTGDDFGGQDGPLLPESTWLEFLADGFAEYVALAKAYDIRVMHHTCGAVRPLIPQGIDRGSAILQSIHPEAAGMDPHALKTEFGNRLAFHGGISIQRTLPFGATADIRNEVRDRVEALAPGGGYIAAPCHTLTEEVPPESVVAFRDAMAAFGAYPCGWQQA